MSILYELNYGRLMMSICTRKRASFVEGAIKQLNSSKLSIRSRRLFYASMIIMGPFYYLFCRYS